MHLYTVQSEKCLIDGICYFANEFNPSDEDEKCDPEKSSAEWTASESDFTIICHFLLKSVNAPVR